MNIKCVPQYFWTWKELLPKIGKHIMHERVKSYPTISVSSIPHFFRILFLRKNLPTKIVKQVRPCQPKLFWRMYMKQLLTLMQNCSMLWLVYWDRFITRPRFVITFLISIFYLVSVSFELEFETYFRGISKHISKIFQKYIFTFSVKPFLLNISFRSSHSQMFFKIGK